MKRSLAVLTALAMTAGTLIGCGGSADTPAAEQPAQEQPAKEEQAPQAESTDTETAEAENSGAEGRTEITFWHYMSDVICCEL